jgi:RHS repeat-associated core domain protein (fragment)
VYDGGSYTPVAKLAEEDSYSIVQDYMGTPIQALDSKGEVVWDCVLDIYGEVFRLRGELDFIPFRFKVNTKMGNGALL